MEFLPTYGDATSRLDWLSIVAPYVPASSWASCCLVDHRFYAQFAPFLWQDPLVTIRKLGLHPNDDIAWYKCFIHKHATSARYVVRCMVRSLDFRAFALSASGLYSTEASERAISESFKTLPQLFPKLVCLLLEGHPELDPGSLAETELEYNPRSLVPPPYCLSLLDLARCRQELTPKFFEPYFFSYLKYIDISYLPGSLRRAIQSSLNSAQLPFLRVLKARGREVDDATAELLCQAFKRQLWSLDLSDNKLTDRTIDSLLTYCYSPTKSLRSGDHVETEGKVIIPKQSGTYQYGPFEFIQESSRSATFTHPERYFVDAPVYLSGDGRWDLPLTRANGSEPLSRCDEVGAAKDILLQSASFTNEVTALHLGRDEITHLYLNGNNFSTNAIGKLLRLTQGALQSFECDNSLHIPYPSSRSGGQRPMRIRGMFGLSHLFRPVISSNLRSLRAHHSLVTRVPDIAADGLSPVMALRLSETVYFRNISRIYQRFVPDMNPRLTSLTLTNIPARSFGPVIEQIISFLALASAQQKGIRRERDKMSGRHATVLNGLRHIRLELDLDFSDDLSDVTGGGEVDYDKLLDPGDDDFSKDAFTTSKNKTQVMSNTSKPLPEEVRTEPSSRANVENFSHWKSGRLKSAPYPDTGSEYVTHREEAATSWTGSVFSVPVWIGPGTIGPHAAVNEYMWNLQDPELRTDVGPATPSHVAAGVPALSYIFYAAWDAIAFPSKLPATTRIPDTGPLRDVAAAIKTYRAQTRGTPDHWDGTLELVRRNASSRYQSSEYWR
ncbi:hypothetical protein GGR50DRAFT_690699 [Xylaria sp. CBS 124048]|nr:hypothetical protein GGR50DRAFT_690699 [Xylaria sp. CBS 124048]